MIVDAEISVVGQGRTEDGGVVVEGSGTGYNMPYSISSGAEPAPISPINCDNLAKRLVPVTSSTKY